MASELCRKLQMAKGLPTEFDAESTAVPSETLVGDDASEFSEWAHVDEGCPTTASSPGTASSGSAPLGRLIVGADGKPTRVFATSAELRKARLQQLKPEEPAVRKVRNGTSNNMSKAACRPSEVATKVRSALDAKLAAQAAAAQGVHLPSGVVDVGPKSAAAQVTPRATKSATAQSATAHRSPGTAAYGVHRTLGDPAHTHSLPCGNIPFHDTTNGYGAQRISQEEISNAERAESLKLALDKQSRQEISKLGLSERMPNRNPVVSESTSRDGKGKCHTWHIDPKGFQHTLGGQLESPQEKRSAQEMAAMHKADELKMALDIKSREELGEMGLQEHMPARNPTVKESPARNGIGTCYNWHVGIQDYQHTLGGVPDPKPVARPHKADGLNRQLDVISREKLRDAGIWEKTPVNNPVVRESHSKNGGMNWHISPF